MKTILIVDDEYVSHETDPGGNYMRYYAQALKEAGHEVLSAKSTDLAKRALARKRRFDLVILDLMIPDEREQSLDTAEQLALAGVGLAEWFASKFPKVKILVLTNTKAPAVHARLKQTVAQASIFIKPNTTPRALVKKVCDILDSH